MVKQKIALGQFQTQGDPFVDENVVFHEWWDEAMSESANQTICEPFIGHGNIIKLLARQYHFNYQGFDVDPRTSQTTKQDTLMVFPEGFDVVITNPPFLAQNSATQKLIMWPYAQDDLYLVALQQMLAHTKYVAAIVPMSFIKRIHFKERLRYFIILNMPMFEDTTTPVGLALFTPFSEYERDKWDICSLTYDGKDGYHLDYHNTYGFISQRVDEVLKPIKDRVIKFNDIDGQYGVKTIDSTIASIKFMIGSKITDAKVKASSRNLVRFSVNDNLDIKSLNLQLKRFAKVDGFLLLNPFKGLRKDGKYRRRLDFHTIRKIINSCKSA